MFHVGAMETPWWMKVLAALCALTVVATATGDFFFPAARDVEVWFGFEVRGTAARVTAPLHWAIFTTGAWGFWKAKPWVLPAAAAYIFYAAGAHLVWSEVSENGRGLTIGLLQAAALSAGACLLLYSRRFLLESPESH